MFLGCQEFRYYGGAPYGMKPTAPYGCHCAAWTVNCPFETCPVGTAFDGKCLSPIAKKMGFTSLSKMSNFAPSGQGPKFDLAPTAANASVKRIDDFDAKKRPRGCTEFRAKCTTPTSMLHPKTWAARAASPASSPSPCAWPRCRSGVAFCHKICFVVENFH